MSQIVFRRCASFAMAVLLATVAAVTAAAKNVPQYPIEDFLATTNMTGADFSPDGSKILVSSDKTGVINAWAIPVSGSEPVQLTKSTTNSTFGRAWYPKDARFIYTADQGGNERTHVYVQMTDGTSKDVTPGDDLKADFAGWAQDRKSFFVTSNKRDKRYFDLYEVNPESLENTLVYQDTTGLQFSEISDDKRWIALAKTNSEHDSDVYLYDRQGGKLELITKHEGAVQWGAEAFSPDGTHLLLTTDEGNEFQYLVKHDLKTGTRSVVEKPSWDVMYAYYSHRGHYLVMGVNADARTEVRVYEMPAMKRVQFPELPDGDLGGVRMTDDEKHMAFYLSGSRWPSNLYVWDLPGGKPRRLTQNLSPKIDPENLVDGQVVRFRSFDGVEVPGILYKPQTASATAKVPALVNVHGGPGGQSRLGYSGLVQYLVNHGYAVYSINNRGSSGYGKTFFKMDDRKHGEADLDDCVASKKMLAETGWVDPVRVGIMGGSYGGYMVLAALAFRPMEFACGVDIFGVANWLRTLQNIPSWWEAQRVALYEEMGDPNTDAEYLKRISPLYHPANIKRPLLVLQGKNDPRVLQVESDEIVAAVKANEVPVEYIVFPDEGHGFRNKKNQLQGYEAILKFCNTHLASPSQVGAR